jgi:hypothetical protein
VPPHPHFYSAALFIIYALSLYLYLHVHITSTNLCTCKLTHWLVSKHLSVRLYSVQISFDTVARVRMGLIVCVLFGLCRSYPGEMGPKYWSNGRYEYLMKLKQAALNFAKQRWADYILVQSQISTLSTD